MMVFDYQVLAVRIHAVDIYVDIYRNGLKRFFIFNGDHLDTCFSTLWVQLSLDVSSSRWLSF